MAQKDDAHAPPTSAIVELLDLVRPQVEKIEEGFAAIRVTLDALAEHLGGPEDSPFGSTSQSAGGPVAAEPLKKEGTADAASTASAEPAPAPAADPVPVHATAPVESPSEPAAEPPVAPQPPPVAAPMAAGVSAGNENNWSQIIFGSALETVPGLAHLSGVLLSDVYDGDNDAVGMLGNLLTFRSATAERKPKLLKDLGEAFYLWKPTDKAALRDSLIAWLHLLLDEAGIGNRIEVVQTGDRYDMQRHNSRQRGVEVGDVFGWVVLRENGKVYSKANVSAK